MRDKVIFFDFDGVIADTFAFCFRIVESREYITEAEYRQRFEGNIFDAVRRYKKPGLTVEDFMSAYAPELAKCEPIAEMASAIRKLAKRYRLIIISSTHSEPIGAFLERFDLRSCFAEILGSDADKSKVNKINKSLRDHHISPSDALFVTDTLGDMREAEKCGVRCIAVAGGYHDEERLAKGNPFAITHSESEIIRAIEAYFQPRTRFILHGGFAKGVPQRDEAFFREILKDAPEKAKVLLVYFAESDEKLAQRIKEDEETFAAVRSGKEPELRVATEAGFKEDCAWADVIYLHGGKTAKLMESLGKFPDIKELFRGKIVAGDSAGAHALGTSFYSKNSKALGEGLGILPLKVMAHYEEGMADPFSGAEPGSRTLLLREYETVALRESPRGLS